MREQDRVRVAVADNDEAMLGALCAVLDADERVELVGRASTGPGAFEIASTAQVDVVVLDVRLPGGGEPTAQALTALSSPPAVVAVSALVDRGTVLSMLRAGASCYLAKDRIGDQLADVVVRASRGEVVLAVGSAQRLLASLTEV